eukprot:SAG11_NODE_7546_length_1130_cov_2.130941_1_plen_196_part_00
MRNVLGCAILACDLFELHTYHLGLDDCVTVHLACAVGLVNAQVMALVQGSTLYGRSRGERRGTARSHRLAAVSALRAAAEVRASQGKHMLPNAVELMALAAAVHLDGGEHGIDAAVSVLQRAAEYQAQIPSGDGEDLAQMAGQGASAALGGWKEVPPLREQALSDADGSRVRPFLVFVAELRAQGEACGVGAKSP